MGSKFERVTDAVLYIVTWAVGVMILLVIMLGLHGCVKKSPAAAVIDHVLELPVDRPCANMPLPVYLPVPAPLECVTAPTPLLCWTVEAVNRIAENVERMKAWMLQVQVLCGTDDPVRFPDTLDAGPYPDALGPEWDDDAGTQ